MNKKQKIRLFLELCNKLDDEAKLASEELLGGIEETLGIDDPVFNEFKKFIDECYEDIFKKFIEARIEAYDKHLSEECIDAAIQYYSTKEGMEIIEKTNVINQELAFAGFEVSKQLAEDFKARMDALGPDFTSDASFTGEEPEVQEGPGLNIHDDDEDDLDEFKKQYGLD